MTTISISESSTEIVLAFLKSKGIDFTVTTPAKKKYTKKQLEELEDQVLGEMMLEAEKSGILSAEESAKFTEQLKKDAAA